MVASDGNPWVALPEHPPYVLAQDAAGALPFRTELMPGPWYGPLEMASVVLLMGNPGFHEEDDHRDMRLAGFVELSRDQLSGRSPFPWHLPEWRVTSAGRYWAPLLGGLVARVGTAQVADRFAVAQSIPYHSAAKERPSGPIRSQSHTASLVRRALDRGALIIAWRARSEWDALVPGLSAADVIGSANPRAKPYLTAGSLGNETFEMVVKRLRQPLVQR